MSHLCDECVEVVHAREWVSGQASVYVRLCVCVSVYVIVCMVYVCIPWSEKCVHVCTL